MAQRDPPGTKIELLEDGSSPVYRLSGDIDPGAEDVFAELVGDRRGGVLELASMGGSVTASLAIGRLARERGMKTVVPRNTYCLSACAFVWVAGEERVVKKGGIIGFHRPWHLRDGKVIPGATGRVRVYFKELGLSEEVIGHLLAPPETFYYLDAVAAESLGVEVRFAN